MVHGEYRVKCMENFIKFYDKNGMGKQFFTLRQKINEFIMTWSFGTNQTQKNDIDNIVDVFFRFEEFKHAHRLLEPIDERRYDMENSKEELRLFLRFEKVKKVSNKLKTINNLTRQVKFFLNLEEFKDSHYTLKELNDISKLLQLFSKFEKFKELCLTGKTKEVIF